MWVFVKANFVLDKTVPWVYTVSVNDTPSLGGGVQIGDAI